MTRLVRHILNRTTTQRTFSKQECMVLLSQLPLVMCSEIIKTVSISDSKKLNNKTRTSKDLKSYSNRSTEDEDFSFAEFFEKVMNSEESQTSDKAIIPHFVGLRSTPTYPITVDYARAMLIVNKPWRTHSSPHLLSNDEVISAFQRYLESPRCPRSVKLSYLRVKKRYEDGREFAEYVNNEDSNFGDEPIDKEDALLQDVVTQLTKSINSTVNIWGKIFHKGLTFDWSKRVNKVKCHFKYMYQMLQKKDVCLTIQKLDA